VLAVFLLWLLQLLSLLQDYLIRLFNLHAVSKAVAGNGCSWHLRLDKTFASVAAASCRLKRFRRVLYPHLHFFGVVIDRLLSHRVHSAVKLSSEGTRLLHKTVSSSLPDSWKLHRILIALPRWLNSAQQRLLPLDLHRACLQVPRSVLNSLHWHSLCRQWCLHHRLYFLWLTCHDYWILLARFHELLLSILEITVTIIVIVILIRQLSLSQTTPARLNRLSRLL